MARVLFVFSLLFVCQLIRANAEITYFTSTCENRRNGTVADLEKRNRWLSDFIYSIPYDYPRFYNTTGGDFPNKVYVLFQCREDLSLDICQECISDARERVLNACSLYNEGLAWYEECMFRFAFRNIFSLNETSPPFFYYPYSNVSNIPSLTLVKSSTVGVIKAAAVGANGSHFAVNETNITPTEKFYCLAQCTRDLDISQCESCLETALQMVDDVFIQVFFPSCQLSYDYKSFTVEGPPISAFPTSTEKKSLKPGIIAAIASSASLGFLLLVACSFFCLRRTRPEESLGKMEETSHVLNVSHDVVTGAMDDIRNLESLQFDLTGVEAATSNFSEENKLGQGGFGEVYKGEFANGEEIAVKRLSKNSQQGAIEFKNEVLLLAKLQHRNLVKLLGFCISGEEKILIYEFLSNLSLDRFLYDPLKRSSLDWERRYKIITGIARGLLYLHEDSRLKIIHRDLKASNILLDEAMNAKIADFGIARLFNLDQTQGDTMRIAGTYGYMAPEYALAGHFSVKSDVYSFGVIVLEIVSGQRNTFFHQQPDEGLVYRAWRLWNENAILELVDPLLGDDFSEKEVKLCIRLGLMCIQEDASHRPRMTSVITALNGQAITLPPPNAPHFFTIGVETDTKSSNLNLFPENEDQGKQSDDAHTGPVTVTDLNPR